MKYHKMKQRTPQSQPLDERQVKNNAGGYVYELPLQDRLRRFLILGSDQNTYYASASKMTTLQTAWINDCWATEPTLTAAMIKDVSHRGLAPKVDPTIYALALGIAHKDDVARAKAKAIFPDVIRTASHLFSFLAVSTELRGWGRALKSVVKQWYEHRTAMELAYQGMKYRNREGFTHQRAIELSHPRVLGDASKGAILRHLRGQPLDEETLTMLPERYAAFMQLQKMTKKNSLIEDVIDLVQEFNLPREAIPTDMLNEPHIWRALAEDMPLFALLRNLGTLSRHNVLRPEHWKRFKDDDAIKRARLHPYSVLLALATYRSGHGERSSWTPNMKCVAALNDLFYRCFQAVQPTGKRYCLALDVSQSMTWGHVQGGNITAQEASGALALVTMAVEDNVDVFGFSTRFMPLPIHERMSLEEVMSRISRLPHGGTDCSLPMVDALQRGAKYDAFVVYTDNETWAGRVHPAQALKEYRKKMGIDAKLIVVGMTATNFTIADPNDTGMLDIVGFDSSAPQVMNSFLSE